MLGSPGEMGAKLWDGEHLEKPWAHLCCGQNPHLSSLLLVWFSWDIPEVSPVLPWNSVIWGGHLDFCFSRFKTQWGHFYLGFCLFLQSILSLYSVLNGFYTIPKRGYAKECSNYCTIALMSHASKVMLKILQARLQQYMNCEIPDVQAGFRKGIGPEIKLPTSAGSLKKQERSRKTSIFTLLTMPKPLTVWITRNCRKFWKRCEYQTTWHASWETCMQIRKQQLELDMEQQTGSK